MMEMARLWVKVRGHEEGRFREMYDASGRRMDGGKLLFHLRLRQLGKTAALCLLPNYEREKERE
jgi:hypothetical protein